MGLTPVSELCVERLGCGTTAYRFPPAPPPATEPPKHERGGYVPPEAPKLSYVSLPGEIIFCVLCLSRHSGLQIY